MEWFPKIFKILGLWPPHEKRAKIAYYSVYIAFFAVFTLHLNISEIIQCYLNRNDFRQTLLNLGIIVLHLIATMRIVHWHFVRNDCKKLLRLLLNSKFTFARYHLGVASREIEELEAFRVGRIQSANKQSCSLYFGVIFLMFGDICVSYISVRVINAWEMRQNGSVVGKILPYNTYFVFDVERYYDAAWLYQFLSILYTMYQMGREWVLNSCFSNFGSAVLVAIDVFVISIIINITSQLEIVQKALRTLDDFLHDTPAEKRGFVKETKLVQCINETQRLLW